MKKFKLFKNKFKKFLKKNKNLVNFVVKAFVVFKFVLDVLDLVFKLKDLCPFLNSLGSWLLTYWEHFKHLIQDRPLALAS